MKLLIICFLALGLISSAYSQVKDTHAGKNHPTPFDLDGVYPTDFRFFMLSRVQTTTVTEDQSNVPISVGFANEINYSTGEVSEAEYQISQLDDWGTVDVQQLDSTLLITALQTSSLVAIDKDDITYDQNNVIIYDSSSLLTKGESDAIMYQVD